MGQPLATPVTEKHSTVSQDERYLVATSCMQGWRCTMEDSHTDILSLPDDPNAAFFAVFDGHGGSPVAEYASKHLHKYIIARPEYRLGNVEEAIRQGFLELDAAMRKDPELQNEPCGSTAVAVLIKDDTLYCANAGDSRAVASVNGKAEELSVDHKPDNQLESERILAGGGYVEFNRVNGILALSRAFGDFAYKGNADMPPEKQVVTAYPDIVVRKITKDWEFVILACDGIWEVVSSQDAVDFCQLRLAKGSEVNDVCERLMDDCLAPNTTLGGLGCDNMTVMLVCLTSGTTFEDLQKKIQQNIDENDLKEPAISLSHIHSFRSPFDRPTTTAAVVTNECTDETKAAADEEDPDSDGLT